MSEGEILLLVISTFTAILTAGATRTNKLHPLYLRGNPAPGIVRLAVILSMAWIVFVLWRYADPSVQGIYDVFYLVMGYAVVKLFGQVGASRFGVRFQVDTIERRNVPAALVIAAFTLATGLIFGGSLWGEADPVGNGEGGWWIPVSFFALGWTTLVVAFRLYRWREGGAFAQRLHRERSMADARAAGAFLLGTGIALTEAVSGDFWGWRHALLTFGVLAALVLAHELFAGFQARADRRGTAGDVGGGEGSGPSDARRTIEAIAYLLIGLAAWGMVRLLDLGVGAR